MPDACDERFAAAMRRLTDLHAEASLYRRARPVAERAFADGLRVGDGVRRAVRQHLPTRPDEADCASLDEAVARIASALQDVARGEGLARLAQARARGETSRVAALACELFSGLAPHAGPATHGYRAVAVRERRRGGETLPAVEDLARRLAESAQAGLGCEAHGAPHRTTAKDANDEALVVAAPRPLILVPSLDGCGSEVALRVALAAAGAPVLAHEDTGDLWIFAESPLHPVEVALRAEPDDEWWSASPLPYADYVDRLRAALTVRGIANAVEAPAARW